MVRKRSWPAVSHYSTLETNSTQRYLGRRTICSLTVFPSSSIVRIFWSLRQRLLVGLCQRDDKTYEVDTNGRDIRFGVCVIGESQQQARLSNTRVTDKQKLEEVVVSEDDVNVTFKVAG